jgi:hypothetical protein
MLRWQFMDEESLERPTSPQSWWADRWLALLPLTVMTWTIYDVVTHEFNKWIMLRTVLLVVFSVPAMIGALLGGSIGFRVGSTIGLALVLMGFMVGLIVIRFFLV